MIKNNYSYSIRVGYDRVEQIREGVSGGGLEGASGKRDCHCAPSRNLNVSMDEAVTISSCNLFEHMLATTGFTPLLVNLESMTSKPSKGGGSKTVPSREGRASFCTCR